MRIDALDRLFANRFVHRALHKTFFAAVMFICIAWSAASALLPAPARGAVVATSFEWPHDWDGRPLRPLALSAVEHRFAERFPGAIARMTDGEQTLVMRQVNAPTRMLHPAADCYRALGWRIQQTRLESDAAGRRWRCFVGVDADGRKLRVCERIVDAQGVAFTDTSAWYWAAASGESAGPWQAVTLARRIE